MIKRILATAATAALIAPALVPLSPSSDTRPSSSSLSSTPQVKAPWAPPPCRARLMTLVVATGARAAAEPLAGLERFDLAPLSFGTGTSPQTLRIGQLFDESD